MTQRHTALRPISRLRRKCLRSLHSTRHLSPHPGPLPRGEGEFSAGFRQNRAWSLPDELTERSKPPPTVPSPHGRSKFASPPAEPEVSQNNDQGLEETRLQTAR